MTRRAWLLTLGAVAARAIAALLVRVIDSDGARNLQMAALIEQGRFIEALRLPTPTPPLHPYLTALLNVPLHHLLAAGVSVSVILGGLATLPLYAMARRTWDDRVATAAAALYALLPAMVDIHAEPMTEGTFMFFFLTSIAVGWRALELRSWETTVAAAFCAALAWLARPEGIYLLPLFIVAALLRFSRFAPGAIVLFAAVWLVVAFPYLAFIHAETGHWQTSLSPYPGLLTGYFRGERHPELLLQEYGEYKAVREHGVLLGGGGHLLSNLFGKVLFYVLGPFLILGLFRPRPVDGQRPLLAYGWIAAGGYMVPIVLSFVVSTPFSHRFLLLPAALLLPTVAAGIVRVSDWTGRRATFPLIVAALCLAMLVRDLRPRRPDKIGLKEGGLAVLKAIGPGKRVYSTARALEFYAQAEHATEERDADAVALFLPDAERSAGTYALLGEYPSTPTPGTLRVRVYLRKRSP